MYIFWHTFKMKFIFENFCFLTSVTWWVQGTGKLSCLIDKWGYMIILDLWCSFWGHLCICDSFLYIKLTWVFTWILLFKVISGKRCTSKGRTCWCWYLSLLKESMIKLLVRFLNFFYWLIFLWGGEGIFFWIIWS